MGAGLGLAPNGANALKFIDADYILTKRGAMNQGVQMGRGDTGTLLVKEETAGLYTKNWGYSVRVLLLTKDWVLNASRTME